MFSVQSVPVRTEDYSMEVAEAETSTLNELPEELCLQILSHLDLADLCKMSLVSKSWRRLTRDPSIGMDQLIAREGIYRSYAFGSEKWKKHFGVEVDKTTAESLPKDIGKTLREICSKLPNGTIQKSLMLVWMPKGITINKMGELMKPKFPKADAGYGYIGNAIIEDVGNIENTDSHWVVMTTDVLSESRNKNYAEQQALVAAFAKETQMPFVVPDALSAITCIFVKYVSSGTRSFSDNPWTYIRCQEMVRGGRVIVGGFAPAGLIVNSISSDYGIIGVAALRKF